MRKIRILSGYQKLPFINQQYELIKNKLPVIFPILSLGVLFILGAFIILPQLGEIKNLQSEIKTRKMVRVLVEGKNNKLKEINLDQYVLDLAHLTALLPDDQDFPTLLTSIQKMALEDGLTVEDVKLDLRIVATEQTDFQMMMIGTLEGLQKFLSKLPESKRVFIPNKVTLASVDKGQYRIIVSLTAPFQPPPKDLGGVEASIKEYQTQEKQLLQKIRGFRDYSN